MSGDVIGTLGVIVALGIVVLMCKSGILPTTDDAAPPPLTPPPPPPRPKPPTPQPEPVEAVMVIRRIEVEAQPKATPKPRQRREAVDDISPKRTKSRAQPTPEVQPQAAVKPEAAPKPAPAPELVEAKQALQALGYPARQAEAMLRGTSGSVEDRIKQALRGPA